MMKITRCEGTPEEYAKRHKASGFLVGDIVHISRAPASFEAGWASCFVEEMKQYIGKNFRISSDEDVRGFRLIKEACSQEGQNYCLWPYFVLESANKLKDESAPLHTKSTQNKKSNKMTPFIFHSPRTVSKKAYTLVGILDETQAVATMHIGLSVCSDGDNLNKKIGIAVATGRANKAPLLILQLTAAEQKQSLQKFLSFVNTFTPSFALQTKIKLEVKL